jgi:hypothetical protein
VTLKAGNVLFIPAGTVHSAKNVGSGNAAELATYIVEKGKPLVMLGKRAPGEMTLVVAAAFLQCFVAGGQKRRCQSEGIQVRGAGHD